MVPQILRGLRTAVWRAPSTTWEVPFAAMYPKIAAGTVASGAGADGSLGGLPAVAVGADGRTIIRQQRDASAALDLVANGLAGGSEATGAILRIFGSHANYDEGTWGFAFTPGGMDSPLCGVISGQKENVGTTEAPDWRVFAASQAGCMWSVVPDVHSAYEARSVRADDGSLNSVTAFDVLSDLTSAEAAALGRSAYHWMYKHARRGRLSFEGELCFGLAVDTYAGDPTTRYAGGTATPAPTSDFDVRLKRTAAGVWSMIAGDMELQSALRFGTSNDVRLTRSAAGVLALTGSLYASGWIGAGIAPQYPAHVYHAAGGHIARFASATGELFAYESGGEWELGTLAAKAIHFDTASLQRLSILGTGTVVVRHSLGFQDRLTASALGALIGVHQVRDDLGAVWGYVPVYASYTP